MGERIIYSTLSALEGATAAELQSLTEMASLWVAQLRAAGRFDGRLILLTNLPALGVEGAESIAATFRATERRDLFLERVRQFRHLPVGAGDQVIQLDLDALAVRPISALFDAIQPGALMAARSGFSPLIHDHAGCLLTRRERWLYRLGGWYHRAGVSACVTACEGKDWSRLMRRWSAAVRARGRGRPVPPLGDQSFLNFLFITGAAPVRRLPAHLVHHVRRPGEALMGAAAGRAVVWHFPLPQKLVEMRRAADAFAGRRS